MKKRLLMMMTALVMTGAILAGCGNAAPSETSQETEQAVVEEVENEAADETQVEETEDEQQAEAEETETADEAEQAVDETEKTDGALIRVGGLKGPTTIGLVQLLDSADKGELTFTTDFTLAAAADELAPSLIQGELDMIAVPANLASVLYNKTEGKVCVLAVNTLGVLSIVDTKDSVTSLADLKGKTIYATGQGTTPEYVLRYLLKENGIDPDTDVTIEWKSEATEIVSVMTQAQEEVIAMLPQPFVTVAQTQVEGLSIAVDLNTEWDKLQNGSSLVTGVMLARKAFVEENADTVSAFLDAYQQSAAISEDSLETVAQLVEDFDIVKKPIAMKAIPNCNITFLEGADMKNALGGYLQVLADADSKSIGGTLPGDDFYYER